jgi:hypothetical protein
LKMNMRGKARARLQLWRSSLPAQPRFGRAPAVAEKHVVFLLLVLVATFVGGGQHGNVHNSRISYLYPPPDSVQKSILCTVEISGRHGWHWVNV